MENMYRGSRPTSSSLPAQETMQTMLPVMAYVPVQQLNAVYDTDKALERCTLFP